MVNDFERWIIFAVVTQTFSQGASLDNEQSLFPLIVRRAKSHVMPGGKNDRVKSGEETRRPEDDKITQGTEVGATFVHQLLPPSYSK